MEDSILLSVAKYIGLPANYDVFNEDLIMFINSELSTLAQIGVVPNAGFVITGATETWSDLFDASDAEDMLPNTRNSVQFVKEFVYTRVKTVFDPPSSSFVLKALEDRANELMFRIMAATEVAPNSEA